MKSIFKQTLISALLLLTLISCEHMNDFHYEYIKDGETIYLTKMDSVVCYPGMNRVLINGVLDQAFGVEQIKVYYNNGQDSVLMDYDQQYALDTVELLLEDLEEKSYVFDIYTINDQGNRSVRVGAFATAYGENYRQNLQTRILDSDSTRNSVIYLTWIPGDEMERGFEVKYTRNNNEEVVISIPQDSAYSILEDYKEGLSCRSLYIPEETALDTFASDWANYELQIFASTGTFFHPLLGEEPFAKDKVLRTVSPNTYELEFANKGISLGYRLKIKVLEDNSLALSSVGETPAVIPNGVNTYNPATGTITLNYKYEHLTGERLITETLVKK